VEGIFLVFFRYTKQKNKRNKF